jgi:hypothetical protein
MNSEKNASIPSLLNDEQLIELERLAAIQSFSIVRIARYFKVDAIELEARILDMDDSMTPGTIAYHFARGKDLPLAKGLQQLVDSMETGNISAIEQLQKMRKQTEYEEFKRQVLFGS